MDFLFCVVLTLTQLLLITYICIKEVKRKSSSVFLWATLLVMFGVMNFYSVLSKKSNYSIITLSKSCLFVILFCVVYICVRYIVKSKDIVYATKFSIGELYQKYDSHITLLLMGFIIIVAITVYEIVSFSGGFLNTSWSTGREYSMSQNLFSFNKIRDVLYFTLSGVPIVLWICKKHKLSIMGLVLIALISLVTRNRILVLPLFVFLISVTIFNMKKLKLKYYLFGIILAILVIYVVYGLRAFRHYGSMDAFISKFDLKEFVNRINTYIATDNGELGLHNVFYYFIENNNFEGFGTGGTYLRMLMVYIPTSFSFGLKPDDFAQVLGAAIGMGAGGSTHPTLFGDCYTNFGWGGIFLGGFWAIYCSIADKITLSFKNTTYRILAYSLFATTFVTIGRGSVYNSFFLVAFGIPFLIMISVFIKYVPKFKLLIKRK